MLWFFEVKLILIKKTGEISAENAKLLSLKFESGKHQCSQHCNILLLITLRQPYFMFYGIVLY